MRLFKQKELLKSMKKKEKDVHVHVTIKVTFMVTHRAHVEHLQVNKVTNVTTFRQTCYTDINGHLMNM